MDSYSFKKRGWGTKIHEKEVSVKNGGYVIVWNYVTCIKFFKIRDTVSVCGCRIRLLYPLKLGIQSASVAVEYVDCIP